MDRNPTNNEVVLFALRVRIAGLVQADHVHLRVWRTSLKRKGNQAWAAQQIERSTFLVAASC